MPGAPSSILAPSISSKRRDDKDANPEIGAGRHVVWDFEHVRRQLVAKPGPVGVDQQINAVSGPVVQIQTLTLPL